MATWLLLSAAVSASPLQLSLRLTDAVAWQELAAHATSDARRHGGQKEGSEEERSTATPRWAQQTDAREWRADQTAARIRN